MVKLAKLYMFPVGSSDGSVANWSFVDLVGRMEL
jgi:hypothetical protein